MIRQEWKRSYKGDRSKGKRKNLAAEGMGGAGEQKSRFNGPPWTAPLKYLTGPYKKKKKNPEAPRMPDNDSCSVRFF